MVRRSTILQKIRRFIIQEKVTVIGWLIVLLVAAIVLFGDIFAGYKVHIGNAITYKYHNPGCRLMRQVKREDRIGFKSVSQALASGYSACSVCNPPMK